MLAALFLMAIAVGFWIGRYVEKSVRPLVVEVKKDNYNSVEGDPYYMRELEVFYRKGDEK